MLTYAAFHQHFGSDFTSASFAFDSSRGRGTTLTLAALSYAMTQTWKNMILGDITTKVLVKCCILMLMGIYCVTLASTYSASALIYPFFLSNMKYAVLKLIYTNTIKTFMLLLVFLNKT